MSMPKRFSINAGQYVRCLGTGGSPRIKIGELVPLVDCGPDFRGTVKVLSAMVNVAGGLRACYADLPYGDWELVDTPQTVELPADCLECTLHRATRDGNHMSWCYAADKYTFRDNPECKTRPPWCPLYTGGLVGIHETIKQQQLLGYPVIPGAHGRQEKP